MSEKVRYEWAAGEVNRGDDGEIVGITVYKGGFENAAKAEAWIRKNSKMLSEDEGATAVSAVKVRDGLTTRKVQVTREEIVRVSSMGQGDG